MSTDTQATVALVLGSVALAAALVAVGLAVVVMRQSSSTHAQLRRHRIAHDTTHGTPDPQRADARPRRGAIRYGPPTGTHQAVTTEDKHLYDPATDDAPTVEASAQRPRPDRSTPR
jgi:hypothetical protein